MQTDSLVVRFSVQIPVIGHESKPSVEEKDQVEKPGKAEVDRPPRLGKEMRAIPEKEGERDQCPPSSQPSQFQTEVLNQGKFPIRAEDKTSFEQNQGGGFVQKPYLQRFGTMQEPSAASEGRENSDGDSNRGEFEGHGFRLSLSTFGLQVLFGEGKKG